MWMNSSLLLLFMSIFQPAIITRGSQIGFIFQLSQLHIQVYSTHCTNCLCSYNLFVAIPLILNKPWPTLRILATHTRTLLLNNFKRICNSIMHMSIHISNFRSLLCLSMLQSFFIWENFCPEFHWQCNLSSPEPFFCKWE